MKKLFTLIAIITCFTVSAQTWPSGLSTPIVITAAGGTQSYTIANNMSHVATIPTLTANLTVSITVKSQVKPGAQLVLVIKTNGSETTTFSGSIIGPVVTGSAGKTWSQAFIYNGTNFYPQGAKIQID